MVTKVSIANLLQPHRVVISFERYMFFNSQMGEKPGRQNFSKYIYCIAVTYHFTGGIAGACSYFDLLVPSTNTMRNRSRTPLHARIPALIRTDSILHTCERHKASLDIDPQIMIIIKPYLGGSHRVRKPSELLYSATKYYLFGTTTMDAIYLYTFLCGIFPLV